MIYLGKTRFRAWLNCSGNAWSEPCDIEPFFDVAQPNVVNVTDLLGKGTASIVWSSPLPANAGEPLRYIDLMGGQKPHILNFYKNNLGKETRWTYDNSTFFYLEDKKAGRPWITKLPFPVQVVRSVTVEDKWRNTRFSNRYSYHHGYYDHPEREFRGFGRVEQTDIEDFGHFAAGNENSPYITQDKTLYQPPVKTVTWYHTGAFLSRDRILNQFEREYFRPNGGGFRENELPEPDLDAEDLSADEYREALRACKGMALRTESYELAVDDNGRVTDRRVRLFSTAFHNCHIQRLQPRGKNPHSVFLVTESEAITYHYELGLTPPPSGEPVPTEGREGWGEISPRIAHTLNLRMDELGNVLQAVAIGYPRRQDATLNNPLVPESAQTLIQSVQNELHIAYTENRYTNDVITPHDYRLRVPCEVKTYELTVLEPAPGHYFSLTELRAAQIAEEVESIAYHTLPNLTSLQKRLVEHVRMLFFDENLVGQPDENLAGHLPFGQLDRLGLPYESYKIALTEDLLTAVLGDKLPGLQQSGETYAAMLERVLREGGYHQFAEEPGAWWVRSGIAGFNSDAALHYYLPERYTDPFGNTTVLTYDPLDLYHQSSRDPLGNTVTVEAFDYRVLAPTRLRDPNGNLSEAAFDILGMTVAMALRGKGAEGDSFDDFDDALLHPPAETIRRFFTGEYDEAEARRLLGGATARHLYYMGETTDESGLARYGQHPACAAGLLREKHVAALQTAEISPVQAAFEYSDGSGAVLLAKAMAEAGPVRYRENETWVERELPLRWITNGKTVLNNKGKPVKQYEPYFSPQQTWSAEEASREVGVTPIIYYDAAGRTVRTEMPDGTFSRVEFSPWFMRSYDANDTVLESQWFANRGGDPDREETADPPADPDRRAAFLAKIHADTPNETHLDSLGREVVAIAHNRYRKPDGHNGFTLENEKYRTYTKLDAEGKPLWLQDARGNLVMRYTVPARPGADPTEDFCPAYDIAGNLLFQHSNEAGDRWMLPDCTGQPMYAWDEYAWDENEYAGAPEQRVMRAEYDALRRPTRQWLRIDNEAEKEIGRTVYGESISNPEARNLRGQAVVVLGPEGRTEAAAFDFKGNLLGSRRQLLADAAVHTMDWRDYAEGTPSGHLSADDFVQSTEYDALNRMTRLENWHLEGREPAVYTPTYNRRGVLESETLSVRGQITQAIRRIEYNEKGQRARIQYGNGTTTRYHYDPQTFRLTQLRTTRHHYDPDFPQHHAGLADPQVLQQLHYTYDPSGNITEIHDEAYEPVFFNNQMVEPRSRYEYDALYRLIAASGRENANAHSAPKGYGQVDEMPSHDFGSEGRALRNYDQYYTYDFAGNFITMQHIAKGENGLVNQSGSWTRHYYTDPHSNRLLRTWLGDNPAIDAVEYAYDTHGSMLNFANVPAARRNRWDYRDMIHTLDLGGGGTAYYQYDSQKQRTRKHIQRNDNEYWERVYLGGYELYRRYVNNILTDETETHHLFADDQRILIVEDKIVENSSFIIHHSSLLRFQYGNHLGSVALEMTGDPLAPQIISYEEYHPYGTTAYQARNTAITAAA
ncbi:MAG: hypothetical protein L6Q97_17425, partial [Thermoanaerobaculia bacterium]|nr:hypothetical protein [Thermoanaerobaculia bacterium]